MAHVSGGISFFIGHGIYIKEESMEAPSSMNRRYAADSLIVFFDSLEYDFRSGLFYFKFREKLKLPTVM